MDNTLIEQFMNYLIDAEKSQHTIEKYRRDIHSFYLFLNNRDLDKKAVREYKEYLIEHYAPRPVNSMLTALNSFFSFIGRLELKIKMIKIQKKIFLEETKNLTKEEYKRLVNATKNDMRMQLIIETLCSTGMRVSELKYITAENYEKGIINVYNKGKQRTIFLPKKLIQKMRIFVLRKQIKKGMIFTTKSGKSIDRVAIWRKMKKICKKADVYAGKVFPHNLRHLYAKTYYCIKNDLSKLADLLGHSSIDTTRIYIMDDSSKHLQDIEIMDLVI